MVGLSSGIVVSYPGVDWVDLNGHRWREWGRLIFAARGKGYATEAIKARPVAPTGRLERDAALSGRGDEWWLGTNDGGMSRFW
jgi:hypothetical protein